MLPREMDQGVEEVGNGRGEDQARVPWQAKSSATPDPRALEQKSYVKAFPALENLGWFLGQDIGIGTRRHLTFPVVINGSSSPRAIL